MMIKASILHQGPYQVSLRRLLKSEDGCALEAEVGLEVLCNLTHQALEGKFADEELRRLLVTADLAQRHGTGPVPVAVDRIKRTSMRTDGDVMTR